MAYRLDLVAGMPVLVGPQAAGLLRLKLGQQGEWLGVEVLEWSAKDEGEAALDRLLSGLRQAVARAAVPAPLRGEAFAVELRIE